MVIGIKYGGEQLLHGGEYTAVYFINIKVNVMCNM